jgi:PAS domain S-box-containing protein
LIYLTIIAVLGFNLIYFLNYFENPEFYNEYLSLSPASHGFKSIYITFIGALCIYMQYAMYKFLYKQLNHAQEKSNLDTKIKIEQEKTSYAKQLVEKERLLNKELEDEIRKKDEYSIELKETQEMVNTLISNLVGAVSRCLNDEFYTVKYYSDKIYDLTGYYATDFIDNKNVCFSDIILTEDMDIVRNAINESVNNNRPYSIEFRIKHKNGNIVWLHENGQPVFDKKGSVLYLDGITTDITEKKNNETALKAAEEKFKTIVETSPVAISFASLEGNINFLNETFTKLFGYIIEDVPNLDVYFKKIYPDKNYREEVEVVWSESVEEGRRNQGRIRPNEVVMTCKDGTQKYVIVYTALLENGYLALFNDISELKAAEASLSNAKEELEVLNKGLAKEVEERTAQLTAANTQLLKLQKENLQSQFEVLKQQVNPHFLFNSLNVLTSLIKVDADLAEKFTERLSKVYRYVLENKEKDLVTLTTEMEFLRAYVFLLDIRFAGKVFVDIKFNEKDVDAYVVPLALQLLIENAIKHNTFSKKRPLKIELFIDDNSYLNIINNLQNRETQMSSTGVGLVNISKRYTLLSEKEPIFEMTDNEFIAKIPLIKSKNS